ncbi:MAG TPA: hypothetical protein VNY04_05015 [Chthoniobacterales bacterium]|jgi:hypothetical protein|nr:hypothetical protein [Chthoniobacterales bacterium]
MPLEAPGRLIWSDFKPLWNASKTKGLETPNIRQIAGILAYSGVTSWNSATVIGVKRFLLDLVLTVIIIPYD